MQLAWVFLGSALCLALIALFARIRVELEASARGDATGGWAAASGVAVGPIALTGVVASRVPARIELHVFGRRVPLPSRARAPQIREEAEASVPDEARPRRFWSFEGDPLEMVAFVLDERRRFAIESLEVELGYGFKDVALTGKVLGALYALSGVLPPRVTLVQSPRWDGGETWEGSARGSIAVWPGLVLAEVLWYMLRRRARRRQRVR